jgi:GNAT superfamily N-acetyltransferase
VDWNIEIADTASDADVAALRQSLIDFNCDATGYRDGRALSCFLRDDDGRLLAGIDGYTWGGYAWVELLWVDESVRGDGLGTALLLAAEEEARRRGCRTIGLMTHEFQAPDFYPRFGFEVLGAAADQPVGYREFLLQKRL